jgi:hypothetical protein
MILTYNLFPKFGEKGSLTTSQEDNYTSKNRPNRPKKSWTVWTVLNTKKVRAANEADFTGTLGVPQKPSVVAER